jgi:flagellar basal-body rod protein FlgB
MRNGLANPLTPAHTVRQGTQTTEPGIEGSIITPGTHATGKNAQAFLPCSRLGDILINNDLTTQAIEWAMNGLERRSQVTANNIANAEVPNFRASRISFEGQLRDALQRSSLDTTQSMTATPTTDPAGPNGNNVGLENELVSLIETNLRQDAMVQAFNYKAGLLRTAMRGNGA